METAQQAARRLASSVLAEGFKPEALHEYRDTEGQILYFRIRAKHPDGRKWIRPMKLNGHGYELGEPDFYNGKPLYCLDEVAKRPNESVWFVEGEKCADALSKLGLLATTSGSHTSDEKADFNPLAGRTVNIWPDADPLEKDGKHFVVGQHHGLRVAAKLKALGCNVSLVDISQFSHDGFDAADWIKAHLNAKADDILALPRVAYQPIEENATASILEPSAITVCVGDINPEPIQWLWPGRIALGKVSLIAGDPGLGKSLITLAMAATVTCGGRWPVDRSSCPQGDVVLLTAEDDIADTIRPRLDAAGADVKRVHVLSMVRDVDHRTGLPIMRSFSVRRDLPLLAETIAKLPGCRLVVIDPISAYLDGTDSHNNADVRGALSPLADFASKRKVAVVCVTHLNKGAGGNAMYRTTGSLAFVAAARCVLAVTKDKDDAVRRLILPVKNNLGNDQTGLAYSVKTGDNDAPFIAWEPDPITITADEALTQDAAADDRSTIEDAKQFLTGLLADAPLPSKQIRADADGAGYAWATIRRAQKALAVEAVKEGMKGGWIWKLPPKMLNNVEDAHRQNVSTFSENEHLRQPSGDESGTVEVEI